MTRFKSINFCQNIDLKFRYFCQKNTKFLSTGGSALRPPCLRRLGALLSNLQSSESGGCASRPPKYPHPLYICGSAPESSHVFALLISMPCFVSINFYQNKFKIRLFFAKQYKFFECWGLSPQTPRRPFPHCRFLVTCLIRDVCCSYIQVLDSYNEKLLS